MVPDLYYKGRNGVTVSFALHLQQCFNILNNCELRAKNCAKNIWDWICYGIGHICKAKLNTEIQVQIPHLPEVSLYLEFLFIEFNLNQTSGLLMFCALLSFRDSKYQL